jgi:hypothetical protein
VDEEAVRPSGGEMAQDGRPQPRQQQGRLRRGFALLDHSLEQNHINKVRVGARPDMVLPSALAVEGAVG